MTHYLMDRTTFGDVTTAFPHSPQDQMASLQDYLEDKLANGYELVSMSFTDGGNIYSAFRVVAK